MRWGRSGSRLFNGWFSRVSLLFLTDPSHAFLFLLGCGWWGSGGRQVGGRFTSLRQHQHGLRGAGGSRWRAFVNGSPLARAVQALSPVDWVVEGGLQAVVFLQGDRVDEPCPWTALIPALSLGHRLPVSLPFLPLLIQHRTPEI